MKSLLQQLNPLVKLSLFLIGIFQVALTGNPTIAFFHITMACIFLAYEKPRITKPIFLGIISTLIGYTWVNFALYIYNYSLTITKALSMSLALTARILVIIEYSILFVSSTTPKSLATSLALQLKVPYIYAYMSFITLRLAPLIQRDLENMISFRKIKGYFSWRKPHRYIISYVFPLLFLTVKRSLAIAISMQARGFGKYPDRTYLEETKISRKDLYFSIFYIIFLVSTHYLSTLF
ncbi:MAG: energy-coupling factor transporter transmembrane component T [Thermofilum sp.]|uniref:Energy-coupling factor transporter transmembrane protein EcfT n=2 Tax=Thermofilum adornatum TaxID=1365176 RepID=S6A531_9CREN|nr:energy-coupling factor transporter transmembrane component T [Thermofilum adornatum]AGT34647.1 hypothetical protein N186_01255 [Thermofilum adornatum]AJB42384.1 cobalt transport protein [Thermofilum adornatum 1505]